MKYLIALSLLLLLQSAALSQELQGVTDFDKSACRVAASGLQNAVAVKVTAEFKTGGDLTFRDGVTDWTRDFRALEDRTLQALSRRDQGDVWALYSVDEVNGSVVNFKERFVFGNSVGGRETCEGLSERSNSVSVGSMAPLAIHLYADSLRAQNTDDTAAATDTLLKMLSHNAGQATSQKPQITPEQQYMLEAEQIGRANRQQVELRPVPGSVFYDETGVINWDAVPKPIVKYLQSVQVRCASEYGGTLDFEGFLVLSHVDIDGDGDKDFIVDTRQIACIAGEKDVYAGAPSHDLGVWMNTTKGLFQVVDDNLAEAKIYKHKGFAVLESREYRTDIGYARLKGGRRSELVQMPAGGELIFDQNAE